MKRHSNGSLIAAVIATVASLVADQAYSAPCDIVKNEAGAYHSPIIVVLNGDNGDDPAAVEYLVTYKVNEDDKKVTRERPRVDRDGFAKFRVSQTYNMVTVTAFDAAKKELCSEEIGEYKIAFPSGTGGAAKKAATAVSKTPAAPKTVSGFGTIAYTGYTADHGRWAETITVASCKVKLECPEIGKCHCPEGQMWEREYDVLAKIAEQEKQIASLEETAIPRENNVGQSAMFTLGVDALALSEIGAGGFVDFRADIDLPGNSTYFALNGALGATGDSADFTGCVRGGMTFAVDGDRQTFISPMAGWCGILADRGRTDFAHANLRVMRLLTRHFGIQAGLLVGLRISDEAVDGKEVTDSDVVGGAEGGAAFYF